MIVSVSIGSSIVASSGIVIGSGPQSKVKVPPCAIGARAALVQLAGVPSPITVACVVS